MKRTFLYALVGILSFAIFLLVFMPASIIWNQVQADVEASVEGLHVSGVDGSIWQGQAAIEYRTFPPTLLAWRVQPGSLLKARIASELAASGTGLDLAGPLQVNADRTVTTTINGKIASDYVNAHAHRFGMTFPGEIRVSDLRLTANQQWFSEANGELHWTGGTVAFTTFEGPQTAILPPLDGTISMDGPNAVLDVTHAGDPVIGVAIEPTGWARVEIRTRLFILAGLPWPADTDPDAPVLLLEEKVF